MKFAYFAVMRPEHIALSVSIVIVAVIGLALWNSLKSKWENRVAYERRNVLFTPAERSFLGVLDQILGQEYRVIGKVRMADIIRPCESLSPAARTSALNRITSKHFDFAVCDPATLQVIGVIELDDATHEEGRRRQRDLFVDAALSSAGVPIVRVPAQRAYSPAELRLRLSVLFAVRLDLSLR